MQLLDAVVGRFSERHVHHLERDSLAIFAWAAHLRRSGELDALDSTHFWSQVVGPSLQEAIHIAALSDAFPQLSLGMYGPTSPSELRSKLRVLVAEGVKALAGDPVDSNENDTTRALLLTAVFCAERYDRDFAKGEQDIRFLALEGVAELLNQLAARSPNFSTVFPDRPGWLELLKAEVDDSWTQQPVFFRSPEKFFEERAQPDGLMVSLRSRVPTQPFTGSGMSGIPCRLVEASIVHSRIGGAQLAARVQDQAQKREAQIVITCPSSWLKRLGHQPELWPETDVLYSPEGYVVLLDESSNTYSPTRLLA